MFRNTGIWAWGLFLGISGCETNNEINVPFETEDEEVCLTDTEFFSEKIWWPILANDCVGCHNSQGAAGMSKFVLQSSWQTGFMEHNFEQFKSIAAFEVDSQSVVLQKPLGGLSHGGNQRFDEDSEAYQNFTQMIERLAQPVECTDSEKEDTLASVEIYDWRTTLRKASLNLAGRLPTVKEYQTVERDGKDGLFAVLDIIFTEKSFYERVKEVYNDQLLTDRYLSGSGALNLLRDEDYPERKWYERDANSEHESLYRERSNYGIAREPLELIAHVIRNDRPFSEILTADYLMVNPYSARTYGIAMNAIPDEADPQQYDADQFYPTQLDGIPHAGLLTSHMFLNRFPTSDTNVNRHRSRILFDLFMATDVMKLADRPVDPTSIEEFNPTMYTPSCAICHAVLDPPAGAFQNWNDRGQYRPPENGWFQDMRPPGIDGKRIAQEGRFTSLQWLAEEISADDRFATATVHTWYEALTGREPVSAPIRVVTDSERGQLEAFNLQSKEFKRIVDAFTHSDQNLKTLIKALVTSPYYRARGATSEKINDVVNFSLGTARLLTPEMLSRKIRAVTNIHWRRYSRDLLTHPYEYLFFYGGIDSNEITQRIAVPNGIMSNIAQRMANVVACRSVARDFVLPPQARALFPLTELAYLPEDQNGFKIDESQRQIKANLQHLHQQILGEQLDFSDEEIERSYRLFYDIWSEGKQGVINGVYDDDLPYECRATRHPVTDEDLPREQQITKDRDYTVRAWMAVVTYLLSDIDFLYE